MPVTRATREYVITYGSYVVGGAGASAACEMHGYPTFEKDRVRGAVTFDVVLTAGTEAQFATATAALEAAFANPYQDLTIVVGSQTLLAAKQSDNTGLDAIATVTLPGGPPDTARSRRYRIRIEFGVPASWAATAGLRDSSVTIARGPNGVPLVTLRGTFTAVGGSDAKAVYDGAIGAWESAQLSWLGVTVYERIGEPRVQVSINRKTCDFERVYRALIYPQAGSQDDTAIKEQVLIVTRSRKGSEYSPATDGGEGRTSPAVTVAPLMDVAAHYECWIDSTVTTDLESKWAAIEPWVLGLIQDLAGGGSFGLMRSAPSYHRDGNRISADIQGVAPNVQDGGGALIQNTLEITRQTAMGIEFVPVWDGDPEANLIFEGSRVPVETVTRRWRELSATAKKAAGLAWAVGGQQAQAGPVAAQAAGAPAIPAALGGSQWFVLSETTGSRPMAIGVGSYTIPFEERWTTHVRRRATAV